MRIRQQTRQDKSKRSNFFSANVFLSRASDGSRVASCFLSCSLVLWSDKLVRRLRLRPLLGGRGQRLTGATTWRVPRGPPDGGETICDCPVQERGGTSYIHTHTHTRACFKMRPKRPSCAPFFFLWISLAICNSWRALFAVCEAETKPACFPSYSSRPPPPVIRCRLISAGFLPLFQRVVTDGSRRSLSQRFQRSSTQFNPS